MCPLNDLFKWTLKVPVFFYQLLVLQLSPHLLEKSPRTQKSQYTSSLIPSIIWLRTVAHTFLRLSWLTCLRYTLTQLTDYSLRVVTSSKVFFLKALAQQPIALFFFYFQGAFDCHLHGHYVVTVGLMRTHPPFTSEVLKYVDLWTIASSSTHAPAHEFWHPVLQNGWGNIYL